MIYNTNIVNGVFYDKGEIVKLMEQGNYYHKYMFKNNVGDKFLLYIKNDFYIEENTILSLKGNLELPSKQRNRGGFDYARYLYSQNIYGSIYLENENSIEISETNTFHLITYMQNSILNSLKKFLPKEHLGIVLGMIIGDTSYISEEVKDEFKQSGITHLLAVSGSNVTYIILITKFLFNKFCGKSFSNFITIFMIILFVFISGASPSVVRAGIMAIILIFSEILARAPNTISTISVTAILILLYNPIIICDVGFILSFGGTIGIVLFNNRLMAYFNDKLFIILKNKIFKYILEMFAVTLSAQIVLTPVMWYYFNTISLIAMITNLLVAPFVGYITILGIAVYFTSLIFIPIARILSYATYVLVSFVIFISKICASVPYGNILLPTPSLLFLITYYFILYLIFANLDKVTLNREKNENPNRISQLYNSDRYDLKLIKKMISLLIMIQIIIYVFPKNYIEINMIDVGQGDSMLIKSNNYNILIDGGGSENSDYDVGKSVLVPYLLDNTNGTIDVMMISHFHEDHAEGCISVLENLKVGKIFIGTQPKTTNLYEKLLKIAKEKKIPVITLARGDCINLGEISFRILSPKKGVEIADDLNNNSFVIRMDYYNTSLLLTGDIEKETEENLLKECIKKNKQTLMGDKDLINLLDVDILKVAHHGSKSSSSFSFLEAVTPKIALISLGIDNKFGHPSEEIIERLKNINCKIYRTDECGEISLKVYKNGKIKIDRHINV